MSGGDVHVPTVRWERRPAGQLLAFDVDSGDRLGSAGLVGGRFQWSGVDGTGGYAPDLDTAGRALAQHVADRQRDHTAHDVFIGSFLSALTVTCRTCAPNVQLLYSEDAAVTFAEVAAAVRGRPRQAGGDR